MSEEESKRTILKKGFCPVCEKVSLGRHYKLGVTIKDCGRYVLGICTKCRDKIIKDWCDIE